MISQLSHEGRRGVTGAVGTKLKTHILQPPEMSDEERLTSPEQSLSENRGFY